MKANHTTTLFGNPANGIYAVLFSFCLLLVAFTRNAQDSGLQFDLLICMILPAFVLAFTDSKFLIPYVIGMWAIGPEVRRVADWAEGSFQPVTMLSLAPLLATSAFIIPILKRVRRINPRLRTALILLGATVIYGLVVGLAHNGLASIFDLASYVLPIFVLLYIVSRPTDASDRDFWIVSFTNLAIIVASYGWIQFLLAPAWDVFWMNHAPMASIGRPEPLKIRVFSTLNSPGPAGMFLAAALAPMFLERRWRGATGWVGVLLVASALAVTLVRSSWLMLMVTVIVYILLSSGKDRWRKTLTVASLGLTLFTLIPLLPGGSDISSRVQTFGDLKKDNSANARSEFATDFIPTLLSTPFGLGLGTVGLGSKIDNQGQLGQYANFDNGFYAIFITFGLLGGMVVFASLWLLGKAARGTGRASTLSAYSRLAIATLVSVTCGLISGNMLTGIGGILTWLLIGTAFSASTPTKNQVQQS